MKSIASTLSSRVLKKLNPDQNRYTEQDLRQADLPLPLQKKIVAVMEMRFRDSVSAPDSKWFDGESEMIQSAWQAYLRQAESALFIPSDEIRYVIETAMEQLLNTFCKPREQVLDILFGDDLKQTKKILRYRSDLFDEQHYLGYALLRYMDKKERDEITKAEADKLLLNIDQKITGNYSVQDWERVLRPLFELGGGSVPATLIGQFFKEKQRFSIVNRLNTKGDQEMTPEELSELLLSEEVGLNVPLEPDHPGVQSEPDNEDDSVYIEPMTSSDSLQTDLEDEKDATDDQQAGHTEEEKPMDSEQEDVAGDLHSLFAAQEEAQEEIRFGDFETEPETEKSEPEEDVEDDVESESGSLLDTFRDSSPDSEPGLYDEEAESDDDPLPWIAEETGDEVDEDASIQQEYSFPPESSADIAEPPFHFPDSDPDSDEDTDEGSDTEPYGYSESGVDTRDAADSDEESDVDTEPYNYSESGEDTRATVDSDEESDTYFDTESDVETDSEKHTDTPMWKSFLERDDAAGGTYYSEEMQGAESVEENDSEPEPTFLNLFPDDPDDPAVTEPEDESESDSESDPVRLREWLKKDEKRYLKTLFKNSRMAYEQALTDLMIFDDWKSASGYLEREIFIRNKVDLFSETAVDFTDKLHAFFIKHKP